MTNQTNLVSIDNNKLITTSNKVAETFNKRHDHIVRDINVLASKINAPKFGEMFIEASYTDKKGETRPCYTITRDGFTLLAMGFTGKKALEFVNNLLTRIARSDIIAGNNTTSGYRTRKSGDFFIPSLWGMRTENILNIGRRLVALFESPAYSTLGGNNKQQGGLNDK